jgi:preprotein translocase subunit SecG
MNAQVLKIIEIVFGILLVILITFQTKGNALSESVSSAFSFNRTKRGFEKFIFYFTIFLILGFSINTILLMFIK